MHPNDSRFATFPPEPGIEQLRWYIRQTAEGKITIHEFIAQFRKVHEAAEQAGRVQFATPEEARAVWDVLWAVEFSATDLSQKENPEDWQIPEEVLVVVQRVAKHLAE
ncbi:MAG: hypothetical protein JNL09_08325 [Anaerolineales bacterium]|nr:hypothetical protein [Anaerolineales bacterium]